MAFPARIALASSVRETEILATRRKEHVSNPMDYTEIHGWFDFNTIYDKAVLEAKHDAVFVEVGAWFGKSTAYMAKKIKESRKQIKFHVVDIWCTKENTSDLLKEFYAKHNNDIYQQFIDNMNKTGSSDHIIIKRKLSHQAALDFENESLDFVFIDAAHDYESVKLDIQSWFPKVKNGGVIAGHDINWPGVQLAVEEHIEKHITVGPSWWYRK